MCVDELEEILTVDETARSRARRLRTSLRREVDVQLDEFYGAVWREWPTTANRATSMPVEIKIR